MRQRNGNTCRTEYRHKIRHQIWRHKRWPTPYRRKISHQRPTNQQHQMQQQGYWSEKTHKLLIINHQSSIFRPTKRQRDNEINEECLKRHLEWSLLVVLVVEVPLTAVQVLPVSTTSTGRRTMRFVNCWKRSTSLITTSMTMRMMPPPWYYHWHAKIWHDWMNYVDYYVRVGWNIAIVTVVLLVVMRPPTPPTTPAAPLRNGTHSYGIVVPHLWISCVNAFSHHPIPPPYHHYHYRPTDYWCVGPFGVSWRERPSPPTKTTTTIRTTFLRQWWW